MALVVVIIQENNTELPSNDNNTETYSISKTTLWNNNDIMGLEYNIIANADGRAIITVIRIAFLTISLWWIIEEFCIAADKLGINAIEMGAKSDGIRLKIGKAIVV